MVEIWVFGDGDTFEGGRGVVLVSVYVVAVMLLVEISANALEDLGDVWEKKQFLKTQPLIHPTMGVASSL